MQSCCILASEARHAAQSLQIYMTVWNNSGTGLSSLTGGTHVALLHVLCNVYSALQSTGQQQLLAPRSSQHSHLMGVLLHLGSSELQNQLLRLLALQADCAGATLKLEGCVCLH